MVKGELQSALADRYTIPVHPVVFVSLRPVWN
jgi:hypothetical protein